MKYKLIDLVNLDELQTLMEHFSSLFGVGTGIVDLDGNWITKATKPSKVCMNFHRANSKSLERCIKDAGILATKLLEGKKYAVQHCQNGMNDAVTAICIDGEHLANLFISQFLLGPPDINFFKKQAAEFGYDEEIYLKLLKEETPIISEEKVIDQIQFLCRLAEIIANLGLTQKKQLEMNAELEKHRDNLEELVNQRTIDLLKAKEAAETANQAKSAFLANMSHEIRTPMNAVLGFTEILQNKVADPQLKRCINSIHISGKSLLTLINDILDLSKIEAGKLQLNYSAISLRILFNELEIIFTEVLRDKQLKFIKEIASDLPELLILDETRIRQIFVNLLGNAVKFTDEGYIKISAHYTHFGKNNTLDELQFCVEDTGIGIASGQKKVIFEAFEQQKGQKEKQYGGTGLGLSITKRLIEMMNGQIKVESEVGKGSLFSFLIKDVKIASSEELKAKVHQNIDPDLIEFEAGVVLVVDDVRYNRDIIAHYLESYQFSILEAENGKEAIEMAKKYNPDLILLDLKMPVMDGHEAMEILKSDKTLKNIPVIVVSASSNEQEEEEILKDSNFFIRKPLTKTDLISKMVKLLPHTVMKDINHIMSGIEVGDYAHGDIDKIKSLLTDLAELIYTDLVKAKICLESLGTLLENLEAHKVFKKLENQMDNFETESALLSLEKIAQLLDISIEI